MERHPLDFTIEEPGVQVSEFPRISLVPHAQDWFRFTESLDNPPVLARPVGPLYHCVLLRLP